MRNMVLGVAAACAAIIVPAAALAQSHAAAAPRVHRGHHDGGDRVGDRFPDGRDGKSARRHRGDAIFVNDINGGEWALYNNRSWTSDSYNDWWHDRPDRAFPRWVQQSQQSTMCDENRMWWSGAGWRC